MEKIKLTIEVEIPRNEWGPMLICDDPEHWPLVGYSFLIQRALMKRLGFSEEIMRLLEREARKFSKETGKGWYHTLVNLAQDWAEKTLAKEEEHEDQDY